MLIQNLMLFYICIKMNIYKNYKITLNYVKILKQLNYIRFLYILISFYI